MSHDTHGPKKLSDLIERFSPEHEDFAALYDSHKTAFTKAFEAVKEDNKRGLEENEVYDVLAKYILHYQAHSRGHEPLTDHKRHVTAQYKADARNFLENLARTQHKDIDELLAEIKVQGLDMVFAQYGNNLRAMNVQTLSKDIVDEMVKRDDGEHWYDEIKTLGRRPKKTKFLADPNEAMLNTMMKYHTDTYTMEPMEAPASGNNHH
ncbi:MAG: hypothetical protein ABIJ34_08265 [archaeon]